MLVSEGGVLQSLLYPVRTSPRKDDAVRWR